MAAVIAWWLVLLVATVALAIVGDLRSEARAAIMILLGAGGVYVGACLWLHRRWSGWGRRTRRHATVLIVLGGIALRCVLLTTPPTLSDDVYRYRWDGHVQAAGINPYLEPPASAALEELRDPLWQGINYKPIRTIYPPLAQWLFGLTYLMHGGLLGFQVMAVVGDLAVVALLLCALASWRLPRWRVALWSWSPLAAVEVASSGHYDAWTIAAVLAAVLLAARGHRVGSTVAIAGGVLLKSWPVAYVPLFVARRGAALTGLLAACVTIPYLVYADAGLGILQPWLDYTGRWLFNDSGFWVLRTVTGSQPAAKAIAAFLWLAALGSFWKRGVDASRGSYWLLQLTLILAPAVHPWYLLWPLPLAALALDRGWIALTVLAPLSYWILVVNSATDSGAWVEPTWVRFAVYLPALGVWLHQRLREGAPAPPPLGAREPSLSIASTA